MTTIDTGPGDSWRTTSPEQFDEDNSLSPLELTHIADAHWRAYLHASPWHPADDAIEKSAHDAMGDSAHFGALMRLLHGTSVQGDVQALEMLRAEIKTAALKDLASRIDEGVI